MFLSFLRVIMVTIFFLSSINSFSFPDIFVFLCLILIFSLVVKPGTRYRAVVLLPSFSVITLFLSLNLLGNKAFIVPSLLSFLLAMFIDLENRTSIFISVFFYLFSLSILKTNPYTPVLTSIFLLLIYFRERKILYVLPLLFLLFLPIRINAIFPLKSFLHASNRVEIEEKVPKPFENRHIVSPQKVKGTKKVTDVTREGINEWKREIPMNIILYSTFLALFFLLMMLVKMRRRFSKVFLMVLFFVLGVFFVSFLSIQLIGLFMKDLKHPLSTGFYGKTSEELEYSLKTSERSATGTSEKAPNLDLTPIIDVFTWIVTGLSIIGAYLSISLFLKTTEEKRIEREESKSECCFSKENDLEGILSIKDERFIFRAYLWLRKTFFPTHDNLTPLEILKLFSGENFMKLTGEFIRIRYALRKPKRIEELKRIFRKAVEELEMWRKTQAIN